MSTFSLAMTLAVRDGVTADGRQPKYKSPPLKGWQGPQYGGQLSFGKTNGR